MLGWARLLASGKLDAEQSAQAVRAIERAGWAQSRLIEDLLDISRIVAGKLAVTMRPTDAASRSSRRRSTSLAAGGGGQADHRRRCRSIRRSDRSPADPDRLQQIVWNLVSNAIKFTPAGGAVEVRLAVDGDRDSV